LVIEKKDNFKNFNKEENYCDINIDHFKEKIDSLIKNEKYEEILKLSYDFLLKSGKYNTEILNLMIFSLINLKEFDIALAFLNKLIILKDNDNQAIQNLAKVKSHLENQLKINKKIAKNTKGLEYLLTLFDNIEKATVSLCMIVKNEESNLARCLNSVKDIVSEIVIVDTGSTDNTIKIAEDYNAKIIFHKWDNDFSSARNKSIENATCDYILFLDADEYLDKDSLKFFKSLKKPSYPHSYFVKIINFTNNELERNYSVEHYFTRIWTNNPNYRFTGKIHENLIFLDEKIKPVSYFADVTVYHSGYLQSEIDRKGKLNRNLNLLLRAVDEDPNNSFNYYNLGIQYKNMGLFEKAVENFLLLQEKQNNKNNYDPFYIFGLAALSSTYIQLGNYNEAILAANKALEINKNFTEALFNKGLAQYYLGDYKNAIINLNKILQDNLENKILGGTLDLAIRSWKTLNMLGLCYLNLKNYKLAIKNLRKGFKINKYSGEIVLNLIAAYYEANKISLLSRLIDIVKNVKYSLQIIFSIYTKLNNLGFTGIAKRFLETQKDNFEDKEIFENYEKSLKEKENLFKANFYFEQKDYIQADKFYSNYFSKDNKSDRDSLNKWGYSNLCLKDYIKAENIFEKLSNICQDNWQVLHNLATAKMGLAKIDEAIALFKRAKEIYPDCVETYVNLGKIYLFKKEYLNAFETFSYAELLDKENSNIENKYYLLHTLYLTNNFEDAIKKSLKFISSGIDDPEIYNITGLCYFALSDFLNSALYFTKAINLDNKKVDYYINLANSLKRLEIDDEALNFYKLALELDKNNFRAKAGLASIMLKHSLNNSSNLNSYDIKN